MLRHVSGGAYGQAGAGGRQPDRRSHRRAQRCRGDRRRPARPRLHDHPVHRGATPPTTGSSPRYRGLIEDTSYGDAAVVYYSGHGGRQRNALARPTTRRRRPGCSTSYRPTSRTAPTVASTPSLAQELSLLQRAAHRQDTERHDDPRLLPQRPDVEEPRCSRRLAPRGRPSRSAASRGTSSDRAGRRSGTQAGDSVGTVDANPLGRAARGLLARRERLRAGRDDAGRAPRRDDQHARPVLKSATRPASMTWRDVIDVVRATVMDLVPQQRPELEGPLAPRPVHRRRAPRDRRAADPGGGRRGAARRRRPARRGRGRSLRGRRPRRRPAPAARHRGRRRASSRDELGSPSRASTVGAMPAGAAAHPIEVSLGARPVAVRARRRCRPGRRPSSRRSSSQPWCASSTEPANVARHHRARRRWPPPRSTPAASRCSEAARRRLAETATGSAATSQTLARATHVRELGRPARGDAGRRRRGDLRPPAPRGEARRRPAPRRASTSSAATGSWCGAENTTSETRFVSVLDVGVSGTVAIHDDVRARRGRRLRPRRPTRSARSAGGALEGIELFWPPAVPGDGPRPETIDHDRRPTEGRPGSAASSRRASRPRRRSGRRDAVGPGAAGRGPQRRSARRRPGRRRRRSRLATGCTGSTSCSIGRGAPRRGRRAGLRDRGAARSVVPARRAEGRPSRRAGWRCASKELTVHSNRAILAAAVRVDALVVTAPAEGSDKRLPGGNRSLRPGQGRRPAAVRRHARVRGTGRTVPRPRRVGGQGRPPRPRPRRPPGATR